MYTQHVHMILNGAAALVHIKREREREVTRHVRQVIA